MQLPLPSMRTLARVLAGLAIFAGVVLGVAWLALPRWIAGSGMALASDALGRPVSVAAVRFEPWRLGLVVEGLRVGAADARQPPQLEVGRVDAALSLRSLWHLAPVVESLRVEHPVLRVARTAAGHYDVDDLLARLNAPKPPPPPEAKPARFALYNLELADGEVRFDDAPAQRVHVLDRLTLSLPFVSSFAADVQVRVTPSLDGRLNGVPFGGSAAAEPFLHDGESDAQLRFSGLDLAPYLGYLPASLPLRIGKGRLDADLHLRFVAQRIELGGQLALADFAAAAPQGATRVGWRRLDVQLKSLEPLQRELAFDAIKLDGLALMLDRDAAGGFGLAPTDAAAPPSARPGHAASAGQAVRAAQASPVAPSRGPAPASAPAAAAPAPTPWRISLEAFELADAVLAWHDRGVQPAAQVQVGALNARLDALRWPLAGTAKLQLAMHVGAATLQGQGTLAPDKAVFGAQWQGLALAPFMPYAGGAPRARVSGLLDGRLAFKVAQPLAPGAAERAELSVDALALREFAVATPQGAPVLGVAALRVASARVLPGAHKVELGAVRFETPRVDASRDAAGQLNFAALMAPSDSSTSAPPVRRAGSAGSPGSAASAGAAAAPAWSVSLAGVVVEQGALRWRDAAVGAGDAGADVQLDQLAFELGALDWPRSAPTKVKLALRVGGTDGAGGTPRGSLLLAGRVGLAPLQLDASLQTNQLPLQVLSGYLDPAWNLRLRRVELGVKGRVTAQQAANGWRVHWLGDALLADLRLQQLKDGDGQPLLSWGALNFDGLDVALRPGDAPSVALKQLRLDDFFARLLVNEQGQLNLREIGPGGAAVTPGQAASAAAATAVTAASAPAAPPAPASAVLAAAPAASAPPLHLSVGGVQLSKGKVDFTDHFIRPNYSAELSELEGRLGGFSSDQPALADVDLHGRVAGTGLLTISGKVNPATKPPLLDLGAAATDIELAPLSPYALKYAGYEIARGKLTTKVHYRIDAGGKLEAANQVILNQLEFGAAIASPDATKLPVRLAVALLKDSHGVIDVNLPISGSINDPEFSVGGIIVKLIVNLIGKALTAPFSLFSGGGTSDLSQLACAPGAATLADASQLDALAQMLQDRPGLTLTITGAADLARERVAIEQAALDGAIERERRRERHRRDLAAGSAASGAAADAAPPPLGAAERERLLKLVYDAAKLPNKPRNLIGLAKDIPAEQMRALLLPSYPVDAQSVRDLALARSVGVRDALVARGIASSRLFLGAPQVAAEGDATAWQPHIELKLGAQ